MTPKIKAELEARTEAATKAHGDRRTQIILEAACELCLCQFGVAGTIDRLQGQIDFLREYER